MAVSKFNPDTCQTFAEGIFDGLTIAESAKAAGVSAKTVKNWLSKGRAEDAGPFADFAASVDSARAESEGREQPMDEDELKLVVSRAAKKGSVAAQKLYWEMLHIASKDPDKKPADAFDELDGDELATAREKRKSA